jgi:hypothetical protein
LLRLYPLIVDCISVEDASVRTLATNLLHTIGRSLKLE